MGGEIGKGRRKSKSLIKFFGCLTIIFGIFSPTFFFKSIIVFGTVSVLGFCFSFFPLPPPLPKLIINFHSVREFFAFSTFLKRSSVDQIKCKFVDKNRESVKSKNNTFSKYLNTFEGSCLYADDRSLNPIKICRAIELGSVANKSPERKGERGSRGRRKRGEQQRKSRGGKTIEKWVGEKGKGEGEIKEVKSLSRFPPLPHLPCHLVDAQERY